MNFLLVFGSIIIGSCLAADVRPRVYKEAIPIITLESNIEHDGKFHFHYESADGSKASQDGYLKQIGPNSQGESIQGSYSYIGDDGLPYSITFIADENGFQPQGAHIPTPPPIPEAIARALNYIASTAPQREQRFGIQNNRLF